MDNLVDLILKEFLSFILHVHCIGIMCFPKKKEKEKD
jgi:hypothetical protein